MTDLIERLRNRNTPYGWNELADKAADEIERLRNLHKTAFDLDMDSKDREIERLRKELDFINTELDKLRRIMDEPP